MRKAVAGLVALTSAVALAGCASTSGLTLKTATCEQFLALSPSDERVVSGGDAVVAVLDDDGAQAWQSRHDFLRDACGDPSNTEAILADLIRPVPDTCEHFVGLPPEVQAEWIGAFVTTWSFEDPERPDASAYDLTAFVPDVVAACDVHGELELSVVDVVGSVQAVEAAAERQRQLEALLPVAVSTTLATQLGYTSTVVLRRTVAPLTAQETAHPGDPRLTLGDGCDFDRPFDATRDLAIPAWLRVTNSSAEPMEVGADAVLVHEPNGGAVTEGFLEGADSCAVQDLIEARIEGLWADVPAGQSRDLMFFVIIRDYYSPAFPEGAAADLSTYRLDIRYRTAMADPIVSAQPEIASMGLVG